MTSTARRFRHAVVAGKFYPPHRGHQFLIDSALVASDRVSVLLCERPSDLLAGELRASWLRELHPRAEILLVDDRYDEQDSELWARNTLAWLDSPPDAVFASEAYGAAYARAMGAEFVAVDPERRAVPCSATRVRADLFAAWRHLPPPVREGLAMRVSVLGAESTGSTTLAEQLAAHYGTVWVPEYGREYTAEKVRRRETGWETSEFVAIAREQNLRENAGARRSNGLLISDTNAFATVLWHRRYLGWDDEEVVREAARAQCDLYLLTGDEIPFEPDEIRDGESIRHEMQGWFREELGRSGVPWIELRGDRASRLAAAVAAIDARRREVAVLDLRVPDREKGLLERSNPPFGRSPGRIPEVG